MSIEYSQGRGSPKYLIRKQLAAFLQEHGYPVTANTLNKLCCPSRGEGPKPVAFWGTKIRLYDPADGLRWAQSRIRPVTPITA
jgi:hypothetical protein